MNIKTNSKQEFIDTLKYGKYHNELLKIIAKFKQHVVKNHNGSVSTIYQKSNKQLVITTYLPDWKLKEHIKKESSWSTYKSIVNITTGNLFSPFVKEILMNRRICWYMDDFTTNGIINYYIKTFPESHSIF